ncbi:hypothetical protein F5Y16DRAFT_394240 [Xylariaceae sp. FL0255]|nr:hypothetical protein F5Y16DRAFT_394240 [Xylariaceae sp. FL0255]
MKFHHFPSTAILFTSVVSAFSLSDHCNNQPDICLQSFLWCYTSHGGCTFQPGVYPASLTTPKDPPLVRADQNYTINWLAKNTSDTRPFTFKYNFGNISWETNLTETSFNFNPWEILSSFPTEAFPNVTTGDAYYEAVRFGENTLVISRAGAGPDFTVLDSDGVYVNLADTSMEFTVGVAGDPSAWLNTQRAIEYNKWKKGVGIGVGIGVPVLLTAMALTMLNK